MNLIIGTTLLIVLGKNGAAKYDKRRDIKQERSPQGLVNHIEKTNNFKIKGNQSEFRVDSCAFYKELEEVISECKANELYNYQVEAAEGNSQEADCNIIDKMEYSVTEMDP